jgi:hypothetical protein
MQKLTGTSSGKNNNSCGIFHHKPNKIGFAIFWFLYDFLLNLHGSAKCTLLFENHFAVRPLTFLDSYADTLGLQLAPWKETSPRNVVLRIDRWRSGRNPVRAGGETGRGRRGGGLGATGVWFGNSGGAGRGPARVLRVGGWCLPRRLAVRRRAGAAGMTRGCTSFGKC